MKISIIFPYRLTHDRESSFKFVSKWYENVLPNTEQITADDLNVDFNRGRALNYGISASKGDILILADADLTVAPESLLSAIDLVKEGMYSYVIPFTRVAYLDPAASDHVKAYRGPFKENYPYTTFWRQPSTGGLNVMTRASFYDARGFDERFSGWGFEDSAFDAAMQTLVGPAGWIEGPAYHLYHSSARKGHSPLHASGAKLCDRYRKAMHNKEEMIKIIYERL